MWLAAQDARQAGGRVLVHCSKGVSRSAALVIAYKAWSKGGPTPAFAYLASGLHLLHIPFRLCAREGGQDHCPSVHYCQGLSNGLLVLAMQYEMPLREQHGLCHV